MEEFEIIFDGFILISLSRHGQTQSVMDSDTSIFHYVGNKKMLQEIS